MASATSGKPASKTAGEFVCTECGRKFTTQHALGGHLTGHARERREAAAAIEVSSVDAEVTEELRAIIAPIEAKLADVNVRIDARVRELTQLRAARTKLEGVLKKLGVMPVAAKGKSGGAAGHAVRGQEGKTARLRELIEQRQPELMAMFNEERATANAISDWWSANDISPAVSLQTLRTALEALRDQGIVRADKVVKGGGMAWALVNHNGGNDGA